MHLFVNFSDIIIRNFLKFIKKPLINGFILNQSIFIDAFCILCNFLICYPNKKNQFSILITKVSKSRLILFSFHIKYHKKIISKI